MAWTPSPVAPAAITACVVAAAAGAGLLLQPTKERAVPAARAGGVNIAVVAPREPVPEPSRVMDVGDLVDGYSHRDPAPPADVRPLPSEESAYEFPARIERPRVVAPEITAPPAIVERREPPSRQRWPFGFDQPRPDYAAERRERAMRREEQRLFEEARRADQFIESDRYSEPPDGRGRGSWPEREPRERERQWYSSDGRRVPAPYASD